MTEDFILAILWTILFLILLLIAKWTNKGDKE